MSKTVERTCARCGKTQKLRSDGRAPSKICRACAIAEQKKRWQIKDKA